MYQRRSQDFCLGGGPLFHDLRRPTRFGGGGVVADIFRDRHKPARFSGGGVVAEIFRDRHKPARFSGGGGSSRNFPGSQ